jgi:hypothetical protein
MDDLKLVSERRNFLGGVAVTAAVGLGALVPGAVATNAAAAATGISTDFSKWLDSIPGKYRQVADAPEPNGGMGLIYTFAFLVSAPAGYGVPESEVGAVVVLRHNGIPIAFNDSVWAKYNLGTVFKVNDPATKAPATRNPFAFIKPGDMPIPDAAQDKLVARGVLFGVCNLAVTFFSGMVAKQMGLQPDAVKQEWIAGLLPGVQVVPSGVVALNGAQSRGCTYCFAG